MSSVRDQIDQKLVEVFKDDIETYVRIVYYLDGEANTYRDNPRLCPALRTLRFSLNNDKAFNAYALRLAEDTKRAETDPNFKQTMALIYSQYMDASGGELPEDSHQCWDLAKLADADMATKCGAMGLARAWAIIPFKSQLQIVEFIKNFALNRQAISCIDEFVGLVNNTGGNVVMVALAAVTLSYDVIKSILRWWRGEISGVRCCKNIIDSAVTIGVGLGGGVAGASIGALMGPIGAVAGGIIGGIGASQAANFLSDRLTQKLFGIPKEEALENAYNYFGVKMNASNDEINSSYRKLCLQHHPDKGGNTGDFHFVQVNMAVIKAARGQL